MAVYRDEKVDNYTVVSNGYLKDKRISFKAKGLMTVMLSLRDDWDYSINGLATLSQDGRTGVRSAIQELEKFGYVIRAQTKVSGMFSGCQYDIYEFPVSVIPKTDNPLSENPMQGKQTQISTKESNTQKVRTKNKSVSKKYETTEKAFIYAKYLHEEICSRYPAKQPAVEAKLQSWAAEIDLLSTSDGYDWEEIGKIIEFSQDNSFWSTIVLSPDSLRRNYSELQQQYAWYRPTVDS